MLYLLLGMKKTKDGVKKIFCLDPSYAISPTSFWNGVIILNEGKGKYSHQYITDKDEKYINVSESLNIKRNNDMSEELQQKFLTNFEKLQTNYVAIKDLEAKRADLDKEIEGYLKELGLLE